MKLAIMQPYFCPYIGYFQLINTVDKFIIYDDVQYIKRGWINRNYILVNGKRNLFTLSVSGASQSKNINQLKLHSNKEKRKLVKTLKHAYSNVPYFDEVNPLFKKIILNDEMDLVSYIEFSLKQINKYLNIDTKLLLSSNINKNDNLKGQNKILNICKNLNAKHYINPIGGKKIYSKKKFKANNIKLNFLKSKDIKYKQFDNTFVPKLSIIDVLMFNSKKEINSMLKKYELI